VKHVWPLTPLEASLFRDLVQNQQRAERDLNVAFTVVCMRNGVQQAAFQGLEGEALLAETKDGPQVVK
jgi:hypothetical protein